MLYDKRWDTKPEITWQQILLNAADILETEGWCQGAFESQDGYCARGAMNKAAALTAQGMGRVGEPVLRALYWAEAAMMAALLLPVITWNDQFAEDGEEVINKLREVANSNPAINREENER